MDRGLILVPYAPPPIPNQRGELVHLAARPQRQTLPEWENTKLQVRARFYFPSLFFVSVATRAIKQRRNDRLCLNYTTLFPHRRRICDVTAQIPPCTSARSVRPIRRRRSSRAAVMDNENKLYFLISVGSIAPRLQQVDQLRTI